MRRLDPARLTGAVCLLVFCGMHAVTYARSAGQIRGAMRPGLDLRVPDPVIEVLGFAALAALVYLAYAIAGAAIASKTRDRILWALPAVIVVFSTVPWRLWVNEGEVLRPIFGFGVAPSLPAWAASLLDLALVLAPAAVVAMRTPRRVDRSDGHQRIAALLVGAVALFVYVNQRYGSTAELEFVSDTHAHLWALFFIGVALGTRRPWFPAVHVLVMVAVSEFPMLVLNQIVFEGSWPAAAHLAGAVKSMGPPLLAVGLGALADPLARHLRGRRTPAAASPA